MTLWQRIRESFWFVPALMCVLAFGAAQLMVLLDRRVESLDLGVLGRVVLLTAGADGSREVLGVIAASMLTVASTTFSITIAVLAVTSSTYGPRLVRNFMADRANQFVLGVYVATFLYALLVLRSIRTLDSSPDGEVFVPHLAVNLAVLLAIGALAVLVYFIHHISDSIQVSTLSGRVRDELTGTVEQFYPGSIGRDASDVDRPQSLGSSVDGPGAQVGADRTGYVVRVDGRGLLSLAVKHGLVVHLHVRPGSYCLTGREVATMWPASASPAIQDAVRDCVVLDRARTPHQDVEFAVQQVLELAVRALSPSTNDPYTAINALDDLSGVLAGIAGRPAPSPARFDDAGELRLLLRVVTLEELVDMIFGSIRAYALAHPQVLRQAVTVAVRIGEQAGEDLRRHLAGQVRALADRYQAASPDPLELASIRIAADEARLRLA